MHDYLVAVDVGTGSARAGLFDLNGAQLARHVTPISLHQPRERHFEQDSEEIWTAVCRSVRAVVTAAGLSPSDVGALGFDATCSLVVRDRAGNPLTVSSTGRQNLDTILWMDHRAVDQAEFCSATGDPLLDRYGGRLSAEMQVPKLLWLKENLPDTWAKTGAIYDLCDFLTWRATGSNARSHSPLVSKWGYGPTARGERPDAFYDRVGLDDLADRADLPETTLPPDRSVSRLSQDAALALGLTTDCLVAPGLIDAYAGTIALFGASVGLGDHGPTAHAALIAGTSSCVVQLTEEPVQGSGCWGAFRDVAVPGLWLTEAGQSASGALLDHMLRIHPAGGEPGQARHTEILDHIRNNIAEHGLGYGLPIQVLPDFHGTRSPTTDPDLTGGIVGLTLDRSFEGLCRLYWRTCVALACSIRHIIGHMPTGADGIRVLSLAGGFSHHPLIPQLYADVTGCSIRTPTNQDPVLFGTALHAAVAAGFFDDMASAYRAMPIGLGVTHPDPASVRHYTRDYEALKAMMRHRAELAAIVDAPL